MAYTPVAPMKRMLGMFYVGQEVREVVVLCYIPAARRDFYIDLAEGYWKWSQLTEPRDFRMSNSTR